MKKLLANFKVTVILAVSLLFYDKVNAQRKGVTEKPSSAQTSFSDSLGNAFRNSVYRSINKTIFWSKSYVSTYTMLKIDIDKYGKVKSLRFSDSGDTLFVKAFSHTQAYADTKLLEKYVRSRSYKDISILIPINYNPFYNTRRRFYYDKMESLMKFDGKDLNGKAILLPSINIRGRKDPTIQK